MASRIAARPICVVSAIFIAGCSSPFDPPPEVSQSRAERTLPQDVQQPPRSVYRDRSKDSDPVAPILDADASLDEYVQYALYHSPEVEASYQSWRAAAERLPQVGALPDPRFGFGYFLEEVQTRTGPQEARVSIEQTFPWPGSLQDREDAASRAALAAWRRFEAARLSVTERVLSTLHDLAYLDGAIRITRENLELLRSFENVLRARYRVGVSGHPELVRVQVELGQVEDRLIQLESMRPPYVADLNASLNRAMDAEVPTLVQLPDRVASVDAAELAAIARTRNPWLLALDEEVEMQRRLGDVAQKQGLPDLTVGLEYLVTGDAINPSTPGSGDDPILLRFGINLPVWREKYDAGVREATARRLVLAHQRADRANRIAAEIQRAWFEHADADRRVGLYERTLIPKAQESLRASLAGFRTGDTGFLDLLDTERTLLEFAIAAERARADRGKALARLGTLVGGPVPTRPAEPDDGGPVDGNEVAR